MLYKDLEMSIDFEGELRLEPDNYSAKLEVSKISKISVNSISDLIELIGMNVLLDEIGKDSVIEHFHIKEH
jgi:hypothetical protein